MHKDDFNRGTTLVLPIAQDLLKAITGKPGEFYLP